MFLFPPQGSLLKDLYIHMSHHASCLAGTLFPPCSVPVIPHLTSTPLPTHTFPAMQRARSQP
jgi:hypothetical protein